TIGLPGCIARSATPVRSSTYRTFFQVFPPSVVRNTPRSAFGPQACPSAPTKTVSAFLGSTSTLDIWPASPRPINFQDSPASEEKYTPAPSITSLRMFASPVPAQIKFGFEGASAIAPIEAVFSCSKIAFQVDPPLVLFHIPPLAAPTY